MGNKLLNTVNQVLLTRLRSWRFLSVALAVFLFTYFLYPGKERVELLPLLLFALLFAALVDELWAAASQSRENRKQGKQAELEEEIEEIKSRYARYTRNDVVKAIILELLENGNRPIECHDELFAKMLAGSMVSMAHEQRSYLSSAFTYKVDRGGKKKIWLRDWAYADLKKLYS